MKRLSFFILAAAAVMAAALSCSKEASPSIADDPDTADAKLVPMNFTADAAQTKTAIDGTSVQWESGDAIGIIDDVDATVHKFTTTGSGTSVTFTGEVSEGATKYFAIYPYDASATADFDAGTVSASVPTSQSLSAGQAKLVTVARTEDNSLQFHHASGLVKFTLSSSDRISRIILRGNSGEKIAGGISAALATDGTVTATSASSSTDYLIEAIPASGDYFTDGTYYITLVPQALSNGFTMHLWRSTDSRETKLGKSSSVSVPLANESVIALGDVPGSRTWYASVAKSQTDVYVSPDGTGDGSSSASPMSYDEFTTILNIGDEATDANSYSIYAYKAELTNGRAFHLLAGTYSVTGRAATFGNYGGGTVSYSIVGDSGAENTILDGGGSSTFLYLVSVAELSIEGITFQNGANSSSSAGGGAVFINGTHGVSFKDCVFSSNTTSGQYGGGAIRMTASSSYPVTFDGCTFKDNSSIGTSAGYGGAVSISSTSKAAFTGCSFSGNSTTNNNGGAVYIGSGEGLANTFTNCSFTDNNAKDTGGAVAIGTAATVTFDGCTFESNTATTNGGGINVNAAATVNITGGSFTSNTATEYGGAVNLSGSAHAVVTITGATVKDNSAGTSSGAFGTSDHSGSTAAANMSRGGTLTAENCTISGNHASNGGVAYICAGYQKYNGCVFTGNWAKTGGAFYCGTGALWVNGSTFDGNYASASYNVIHSSSKENGITLVNNSTFVTSPETAPTTNNADINAASALALTSCTIVSGTDGQTSVKASNADRAVIANNIISSSGAAVSGATSKGCNMYAGADTEAGDQASAPALTQGSDTASGHLWYSWDGTTSFTKATADAVKAVIEALTTGTNVSTQDSDILTDYTAWLAACGGFGSDIRGTARSASAVWPGSYQQD